MTSIFITYWYEIFWKIAGVLCKQTHQFDLSNYDTYKYNFCFETYTFVTVTVNPMN